MREQKRRLVETPAELFITHAADPLLPADATDVLGYRLTRAQRRFLSGALWLIVADGGRAVGLAAYHPAHSDVRVVLECLVQRSLPVRARRRVADLLIDGLETLAQTDSVHLLVVMIEPDVPRTAFVRRGFSTVAVEPWGAWLQKHYLDTCRVRSSEWVQ